MYILYVYIHSQLYHMLYWKNVPPAIALNYFYKEYASHPTTAKFAAKTLQRFKPVRCIPYCTYVHTYIANPSVYTYVITALHYVCKKISLLCMCYNVIC